jgi:hypothetical protein
MRLGTARGGEADSVTLGELNQWLVIDRRLRVLARLAL